MGLFRSDDREDANSGRVPETLGQMRIFFRVSMCLLFMVVILQGCKGEEPESGRSIEQYSFFIPDYREGGNAVVLEMVSGQGNVLTVSLTAKGLLEPVYGVAVELTYDPEVFRYLDYQPGAFLENSSKEAGSQRCRASLQDGQPGRLVLGASRLGQMAGTTADTGNIMTMRFSGLKNQDCRFNLENLVCRRSDLSRIMGVSPFGGLATSILNVQ